MVCVEQEKNSAAKKNSGTSVFRTAEINFGSKTGFVEARMRPTSSQRGPRKRGFFSLPGWVFPTPFLVLQRRFIAPFVCFFALWAPHLWTGRLRMARCLGRGLAMFLSAWCLALRYLLGFGLAVLHTRIRDRHDRKGFSSKSKPAF